MEKKVCGLQNSKGEKFKKKGRKAEEMRLFLCCTYATASSPK
jgi:hypothetical protein